MPVKYYLRKYPLSSESRSYNAQVISTTSIELDKVAEYITMQGSTVTKADILSVMEEFQKAIESLLSIGINVNTPFANFSVSIKGTFNSINEQFDSKKHKAGIVVKPGKRLKKFAANNLKVIREESSAPMPNPSVFKDVFSGTDNRIITPGELAVVHGYRLKYDSADAKQGIFLVDIADKNEIKINSVGKLSYRELIFTLPKDLPQGTYNLFVRSLFGKELRSGELPYTISFQSS